MKKLLTISLVALVYLGIAIIFTLPLINQFSTHIPGIDEDSPTHTWYLWWFRFAIENGLDLFNTNYIFYPQTINRIFDIHTIPLAIMSLPFQYIFGTVPAANIIFLSGFIFSGLGAYFLTNYVTKSKLASFFSGLIFAFFPYTFGQILDNHTNLYTTWLIPFYLLFLLKTIKEGKLLNPVLAGVFFGLQALNDLTNTSFMIILTTLVLTYEFLKNLNWQKIKGFFKPTHSNNLGQRIYKLIFEENEILNKKTIIRLSIIAILFIIISLPITSRAFSVDRKEFNLKAPLWVQDYYSADPSYFIQPATFHPILSKVSLAPIPKYGAIEGTLFIGFSVILLSLIALFKFLKDSKLFLFLAFSYFILMLGPTPSLFNQDFKIPLPFYFYHVIPFIGGIKEPVRMAPFLMLPLAILSGITLTKLINRSKVLGIFLTFLLIPILLFEYYPGPIPTTNLQTPEIYNQISQEKGDFSVLDLPVGWSTGNFGFGVFPIGSLQFYQSIHQKKTFRATVARLPVKNVEYYRNIPGLRYLADPAINNEDDRNQELVKKAFKDLNIKYITIHQKYYDLGKANNFGGTINFLESTLGAKKIYEKDGVLGYQLD